VRLVGTPAKVALTMIPPCPLQFALWGSALYTELAAGLWRALASPWLEPGSQGPIWAADRGGAEHLRTADASNCDRSQVHFEPIVEMPSGEAPDCRVIEVPRARWPGRRATGGNLSDRG
jgi:hypothetical protein